MLGNLFIPYAVLFRIVNQASANWVSWSTLCMYAHIYFASLSFGLKVYFSVRRVVGPGLMR